MELKCSRNIQGFALIYEQSRLGLYNYCLSLKYFLRFY